MQFEVSFRIAEWVSILNFNLQLTELHFEMPRPWSPRAALGRAGARPGSYRQMPDQAYFIEVEVAYSDSHDFCWSPGHILGACSDFDCTVRGDPFHTTSAARVRAAAPLLVGLVRLKSSQVPSSRRADFASGWGPSPRPGATRQPCISDSLNITQRARGEIFKLSLLYSSCHCIRLTHHRRVSKSSQMEPEKPLPRESLPGCHWEAAKPGREAKLVRLTSQFSGRLSPLSQGLPFGGGSLAAMKKPGGP